MNYHFTYKKHDVVLGFDFRTDKFTEAGDSSAVKRDYTFNTVGFFAQYIYNLSDKTSVEGGFRIDYNNIYKVYPLPHVAVRQKWNDIFSTRINLGMGYKLPTIFQDESEEARFINVLPINAAVKPELSLGGTLDLKAKLPNFNGLNVSITQLYFLTHILRPLLAQTITDTACHTGDCNSINYNNGNGHIQSLGVETGINLSYRGIGLTFVYTLTDNHRLLNEVRSISPLTSKHIVSILAGYEIKNFFIGLDCYYYSPVKLSDGRVGKQIWEVGLNVQYAFKFMILFANFENIADIRQTSYGPVVFPSPSYAHPSFSEIYAPLEGRLFNAGFKLRLGAFSKRNKNDEGVERLKRKDD
jgi:iron complex outermembrane receptor protein